QAEDGIRDPLVTGVQTCALPISVRDAPEGQRKAEQEFVERARQSEKAPKGWPAALVMFRVGMWRERMRDRLTVLAEGRTPPPSRSEERRVGKEWGSRGPDARSTR